MIENGRNSVRLRTMALLIFGLGVVLLIRLVLVALPVPLEPTPTPLAEPLPASTAEQVRAPLPSSTAQAPDPPIARPGMTLFPTEPPVGTVDTLATGQPGFVPTLEPTTVGETATITITFAESPSATTIPSPAASATAPPTPAGPTPTVAGRLVNNRIEPPWWPCEPNAIKAESKLGFYYPPDHPRYSAVYVGVTCFPSVAAAQAAGYVVGP
jgi:hypothetical protein